MATYDFAHFKGILAQSRLKKDDALYRTIVGIIDGLHKLANETTTTTPARAGSGSRAIPTPPPTPVVNDPRTYLTVNNEAAYLPNSRRLVAGANISFDDTVANQRTISATGRCYVPVSTGAEPLEIMSDGAGHVLLVGFDV